MIERIRQRLEQGVSEGVFPGAVVGILSGNEKNVIPVGRLTYEISSPEVTAETIYDIASLTKTIPTSMLSLQLLDAGELQLQDTVTHFLPAFTHPDVTIWHLLTQTISFTSDKGFFQLASLKDHTPKEILDAIFSAGFSSPPGTIYSYNNTTSILLGLVVEKVAQMPLDRLAEERFFSPLGMTQTTFHPDLTKSIAPTEIDPWRGREVCGVVHDESAFTLRKKIIPGSAGLFSPVPDLLIFLQMLLKKGISEGTRYFSEEMIHQMTTNQLATIHASAGLGLEMNQPQWMGQYATESMVGKTGFTGCSLLFNLSQQKALVILSNRTYPHRPADGHLINALRRDIADIVFQEAV